VREHHFNFADYLGMIGASLAHEITAIDPGPASGIRRVGGGSTSQPCDDRRLRPFTLVRHLPGATFPF
jgi:hypothetical protein